MFKHRMHSFFILIITIIITFGCIRETEGLRQSDVAPLINNILSMHVSQNNFNDEISQRTLNNILNFLDPWKLYFTATDIKEFMQYKLKIDNFVNNGDYSFLFKIFDRHKILVKKRMKLVKNLIKRKYNFNIDENIMIEREKIKYTSNINELNERWRKQIKFQLLNYINSGNTIKEAKEKVLKKYQLQEKTLTSYTKKEILGMFVNSFAIALDPHSNYLSYEDFEDFKINMELKLEGIGAVLRSENGFVYINSIIPGGPASKLQGEHILKTDDKIIAVAQGKEEPQDIIDIPLRDAVKKIRGKKGTIVKLTINRLDPKTKKGKTFIVPIVRDKIVLEQQAAKHAIYKSKDNKKIGYVKLPTFYAPMDSSDPKAKFAAKDILTALNFFNKKNVDGVVIDLRGNPGGALDQAIKIAGYFIDEGPVLQVKIQKYISVENDTDPEMQYKGPIVVLIDKLSASASEIFAGAIKDYKRGLIIGPTSTYGKGSVQNFIKLNGHYGAIKITIRLFYQPSGLSNNLNGISPHFKIPSLIQLLDIGEDKLKYPLKWSPIKSAKFNKYKRYLNDNIIKKLKQKSAKRINQDKEFIDLEKEIQKFSKQVHSKTISLKKDADEDISKKIVDKQNENDKLKKDKDLVYDVKNDLLLKEAFQITSDYIDILKKK